MQLFSEFPFSDCSLLVYENAPDFCVDFISFAGFISSYILYALPDLLALTFLLCVCGIFRAFCI